MQVAHRRDFWVHGYFACDLHASRARLEPSRRKAVHIYARVSHARALRLVEALGYESTEIDLTCRNPMELAVFPEYDLVLVDTVYLTEAMQQYLVEWVRLQTFAPLIVVGKRSHRRDVSSVLAKGADAIIWLDDPLEVNIAHCKAVLRRAGIS
ncbi:MAG: hypothetical protein NZ553_13995 [Caldilinea sp.]|nr:hypothetical protein [Caldilinea sp.]MDW8441583.1 hypothetical protein [Caldilineaceae bacterium]